MYSDQTDTSSYPESDHSFSSHSSMISDFGEAPLSSTRRSSFFDLSNNNGRPVCSGASYNRHFDKEIKKHHGPDWNNAASHWASEGPSILSSTRMSAVGTAAAMPNLKEEDLCSDDDVFGSQANEHAPTTDCRIFPSRRDTLPAFPCRRASRKSVSFRDVDEYFPVFIPQSPSQQPGGDGSPCISNLPFDMSEYSDFLDSERMATVLQKQGIDVTSPDHVYVFCRESSESPEEDMEKTVINHCALAESDDDQDKEYVKEAQVNILEQPVLSYVGDSSSGSGSSYYSSCESEHYASALDASIRPRHILLPAVKGGSLAAESDTKITISSDSDSEFARQDWTSPPVQTEPQMDSKPETKEHVQGMFDKLLSETHLINDLFEPCSRHVLDTSSERGVNQPLADILLHDASEAFQENVNLPFTPSPFVTGRTRSRLSRCSLRTSRPSESLFITSSLFERTLPTAVRTRRQTPRSQSSEDMYSSPHAACYPPSYSENDTVGGDMFPADRKDMQSSTLRAGSSVSNSQADTLILSQSVTDSASESQTLSDTVILEENQDSSMNAYERNLAEVILAMQGHDLAEASDFLTDLTSTDEATTKNHVNDAPGKDKLDSLKNDVWNTDDSSSESVSSSSSSTYFSPRRSREESDLPCTPGTGCTPRYSMSRLSSCHRPQHLAKLSYTPGGRPLIQDLDEPVEYLYTDSEQGHKLIETHVPPTSNTSLSSSMSASSSEETILYDWRSMQTDMVKEGKENQTPQMVLKEEEKDEDLLLQETRGMTDKELRLRLLELGESPGPISRRTRPTYMRRLCRLVQESNSQSPQPQRKLDPPHIGNNC